MQYSNGRWNELESAGLAMQTGALYLRSTLPDDLVAEALQLNYNGLDWNTDLVAVRREAKRGMLWRFAWLDKSGVALRYKSKKGLFVHVTMRLWEPEVHTIAGFIGRFIAEGTPIRFSKPALSLTKEVGLMMGDPHSGSASLVFLNEAKKQLRLVDVVLRTAPHAPQDRTFTFPLPEEERSTWRAYYAQKLPALKLQPEGRFTGAYQIDIE